MKMVVDVPTEIELSPRQQRQVCIEYIKTRLLNFGPDVEAPFYCEEMDAFLAYKEGELDGTMHKVADGDNKAFHAFVNMLKALEAMDDGQICKRNELGEDVSKEWRPIKAARDQAYIDSCK